MVRSGPSRAAAQLNRSVPNGGLMARTRRIGIAQADDHTIRLGSVSIHHGDALQVYDEWLPPTVIISDGPYGLGKFPGEPHSPEQLAERYSPHAAAWAKHSKPFTTLWFWNSEIGWAKAHPALEMNGWQYEETVVWNKGIAHIAGNVNSRTILHRHPSRRAGVWYSCLTRMRRNRRR